jgi:hypothetical protein
MTGRQNHRLIVLTTMAARVGRSASRGSDTSGKVWSVYLSEAERQDRALAENWKGDTEGILIFVRIVQHSLLVISPYSDFCLLYLRRVFLLLPWQRSSSRATSNCPLILGPRLSSFCNRYPTNCPRSRRAAPPHPHPLSQPTVTRHPFIRPRPPFALTSSGSSA